MKSSNEIIQKEIYEIVDSDSFRLIFLSTTEEDRASEIINKVAYSKKWKVYTFDIVEGLRCDDDKRLRLIPADSLRDFQFVLKWMQENAKGIFVLKNINEFLEQDLLNAKSFKNFIVNVNQKDLLIYTFIISFSFNLPKEIELDSYIIDLPLPTKNDIKKLFNDFIDNLGLKVADKLKNQIISLLQGLRESDIKKALKYSLLDGKFTEEDLTNIAKLKSQIIRKESLVEFIDYSTIKENIGGLNNLKEWINRKKIVIQNIEKAIEDGVSIPKGVLLFGMPGCGKSLAAKVMAKEWQLPLLRLDMGMVLGPYVGQSEENIRKAIKLSEAIAPCILWIDELEKGFAGIGGDGGGSSDVMKRVFGTFLTWMQEKNKPVVVVATANDISQMPPEFLRKGRFDEIFFVDFPTNNERNEIISIHLKKRNHSDFETTLRKYTDKLQGYSGADIEALIGELVESHFIAKIENNNFNLENEINKLLNNFKPLSTTMKDKIQTMKEKLQQIGAKPANT